MIPRENPWADNNHRCLGFGFSVLKELSDEVTRGRGSLFWDLQESGYQEHLSHWMTWPIHALHNDFNEHHAMCSFPCGGAVEELHTCCHVPLHITIDYWLVSHETPLNECILRNTLSKKRTTPLTHCCIMPYIYSRMYLPHKGTHLSKLSKSKTFLLPIVILL